MALKNHKVPFLLSLCISLVFLFPSLVKLEHFFDAHEQKLGADSKMQSHEESIDCSIDLFGFSFFQLDSDDFEEWAMVALPRNKFDRYTEHPLICNKRFKSPRAPPKYAV